MDPTIHQKEPPQSAPSALVFSLGSLPSLRPPSNRQLASRELTPQQIAVHERLKAERVGSAPLASSPSPTSERSNIDYQLERLRSRRRERDRELFGDDDSGSSAGSKPTSRESGAGPVSSLFPIATKSSSPGAGHKDEQEGEFPPPSSGASPPKRPVAVSAATLKRRQALEKKEQAKKEAEEADATTTTVPGGGRGGRGRAGGPPGGRGGGIRGKLAVLPRPASPPPENERIKLLDATLNLLQCKGSVAKEMMSQAAAQEDNGPKGKKKDAPKDAHHYDWMCQDKAIQDLNSNFLQRWILRDDMEQEVQYQERIRNARPAADGEALVGEGSMNATSSAPPVKTPVKGTRPTVAQFPPFSAVAAIECNQLFKSYRTKVLCRSDGDAEAEAAAAPSPGQGGGAKDAPVTAEKVRRLRTAFPDLTLNSQGEQCYSPSDREIQHLWHNITPIVRAIAACMDNGRSTVSKASTESLGYILNCLGCMRLQPLIGSGTTTAAADRMEALLVQPLSRALDSQADAILTKLITKGGTASVKFLYDTCGLGLLYGIRGMGATNKVLNTVLLTSVAQNPPKTEKSRVLWADSISFALFLRWSYLHGIHAVKTGNPKDAVSLVNLVAHVLGSMDCARVMLGSSLASTQTLSTMQDSSKLPPPQRVLAAAVHDETTMIKADSSSTTSTALPPPPSTSGRDIKDIATKLCVVADILLADGSPEVRESAKRVLFGYVLLAEEHARITGYPPLGTDGPQGAASPARGGGGGGLDDTISSSQIIPPSLESVAKRSFMDKKSKLDRLLDTMKQVRLVYADQFAPAVIARTVKAVAEEAGNSKGRKLSGADTTSKKEKDGQQRRRSSTNSNNNNRRRRSSSPSSTASSSYIRSSSSSSSRRSYSSSNSSRRSSSSASPPQTPTKTTPTLAVTPASTTKSKTKRRSTEVPVPEEAIPPAATTPAKKSINKSKAKSTTNETVIAEKPPRSPVKRGPSPHATTASPPVAKHAAPPPLPPPSESGPPVPPHLPHTPSDKKGPRRPPRRLSSDSAPPLSKEPSAEHTTPPAHHHHRQPPSPPPLKNTSTRASKRVVSPAFPPTDEAPSSSPSPTTTTRAPKGKPPKSPSHPKSRSVDATAPANDAEAPSVEVSPPPPTNDSKKVKKSKKKQAVDADLLSTTADANEGARKLYVRPSRFTDSLPPSVSRGDAELLFRSGVFTGAASGSRASPRPGVAVAQPAVPAGFVALQMGTTTRPVWEKAFLQARAVIRADEMMFSPEIQTINDALVKKATSDERLEIKEGDSELYHQIKATSKQEEDANDGSGGGGATTTTLSVTALARRWTVGGDGGGGVSKSFVVVPIASEDSKATQTRSEELLTLKDIIRCIACMSHVAAQQNPHASGISSSLSVTLGSTAERQDHRDAALEFLRLALLCPGQEVSSLPSVGFTSLPGSLPYNVSVALLEALLQRCSNELRGSRAQLTSLFILHTLLDDIKRAKVVATSVDGWSSFVPSAGRRRSVAPLTTSLGFSLSKPALDALSSKAIGALTTSISNARPLGARGKAAPVSGPASTLACECFSVFLSVLNRFVYESAEEARMGLVHQSTDHLKKVQSLSLTTAKTLLNSVSMTASSTRCWSAKSVMINGMKELTLLFLAAERRSAPNRSGEPTSPTSRLDSSRGFGDESGTLMLSATPRSARLMPVSPMPTTSPFLSAVDVTRAFDTAVKVCIQALELLAAGSLGEDSEELEASVIASWSYMKAAFVCRQDADESKSPRKESSSSASPMTVGSSSLLTTAYANDLWNYNISPFLVTGKKRRESQEYEDDFETAVKRGGSPPATTITPLSTKLISSLLKRFEAMSAKEKHHHNNRGGGAPPPSSKRIDSQKTTEAPDQRICDLIFCV